MKSLIAGKSYCVAFYISLADGSQYAINHIGAYLDNGIIDTTRSCGLPLTYIQPQILTPTIIRDTANWIKVEGSFIANGTEKFITLGNFFSKTNTSFDSLTYTIPVIGHSNFSWYVFDDVSVIESDLPADAGIDRHITMGDSTFIGRTPEVGLECNWFISGNPAVIGKGAGIWVKPGQTTTYVVEQTLCGVVRRDSVTVDVWRVGVPGIHGYSHQQYYLFPNPMTGSTLYLQQAISDEKPVAATLLNAAGEIVYQSTLRYKDSKATLDTDPLPSGLYLLHLNDGNGKTYALKFTVK